MQLRLVRERKSGAPVCEHCGDQWFPSTKHVNECKQKQDRAEREQAERSRARAERMGPLLRPPPRKQRRGVNEAEWHRASKIFEDSGDEGGGKGNGLSGGADEEAEVELDGSAPAVVVADLPEAGEEAASPFAPAHSGFERVPTMARPAFLRPVLPPGSEKRLGRVTEPRDLSEWGAKVDAAFASCREWFKGPGHIGWASCLHVERPARRSRDSTIVSDGEIEALRNSIIHQLSAEEVRAWTKRWTGGAVDLPKTQVSSHWVCLCGC